MYCMLQASMSHNARKPVAHCMGAGGFIFEQEKRLVISGQLTSASHRITGAPRPNLHGIVAAVPTQQVRHVHDHTAS